MTSEWPEREHNSTRIEVAARSDVGSVRSQNEDSYLLLDSLFAVADGMGGHAAGEVASALALEILKGVLEPSKANVEHVVEKFREAHHRIQEQSQAEQRMRGMGTTLTAIFADDDQVHIVHIGDSRAYLFRDGALKQLTTDDTLVQFMVHEGQLSAEDARKHPSRSILTRALGVGAEPAYQTLTLAIRIGDRLVLCTDGLTTVLSDSQINSILKGVPDPQAACDEFIRQANEAGGVDNITVIVADVVEGLD